MKTIQKILLIVVVAICTMMVMPQNVVHASPSDVIDKIQVDTKTSENLTGGLQNTIGRVLGFVQIASGLLSVVVIAFLGFNYIMSTPDVKGDIQKKAVPIIVGFVLVFGSASIAKFFLGVAQG